MLIRHIALTLRHVGELLETYADEHERELARVVELVRTGYDAGTAEAIAQELWGDEPAHASTLTGTVDLRAERIARIARVLRERDSVSAPRG